MIRVAWFALLLAAVASPGEQGAEGAPPARHQLRLRGGSLLVGRIEPQEFKATTGFGSLTVPIADLKRIRFGRRADPERMERVRKLVEDLGSANPDRRQSARASLEEEGAFAMPDIRRAAVEHADPEVKRVCGELVAAPGAQELDVPPDDDVVDTVRFSFVGTINEEALRVAVAELGTVTVRRRDVVEVRIYRPLESQRYDVTGDHTYVGNWLDTGIPMRPGLSVKIRAEGSILYPQWGNYTFRPDGSTNMGMIDNMPMGTLVGRVGESGAMFRVGSSYFGNPGGDGTLQLSVLVQVRGQQSQGTYRIRVELEE